jgi:hypothetical protein
VEGHSEKLEFYLHAVRSYCYPIQNVPFVMVKFALNNWYFLVSLYSFFAVRSTLAKIGLLVVYDIKIELHKIVIFGTKTRHIIP